MSRFVTGELSISHINDWFTIGGPPPSRPPIIPCTKLGRQALDPTTGEAAVDDEKPFIPHFRRPTVGGVNAKEYAEHYKREYLEEQLDLEESENQESENQDSVYNYGAMSELESVTESMSSMTLPGNVLIEPEATKVYKNYTFDHTYNSNLPSTHYRETIISTIENNQVTVIQGPTGCGKTTQVPQFILDHYVREDRHCNIVVTQPRRIAAISIAKRVNAERKWQLGGLVGYQVGLDRVVTEDTRLAFVTTGVLLQKLVNTKNMNEYTHVIIDEVHERDIESDFALLLVRKLLRTNSRSVKVILMSASIDTNLFTRYFSHPVVGRMEPAPVVSIEGRIFDVEELYLDDIRQFGMIPHHEADNPQIDRQAYELVKRLLLHFDDMERKEQDVEEPNFPEDRGSVLMFLPGKPEIETMDEHLNIFKTERRNQRIVILPLHSDITSQEQARVFYKPNPGFRKVILSTNIAESSITVPDIKYVIDFMLVKHLMCDYETNYESLKLFWASRANAIQRKGRAGRVASGKVYRLVTKRFWEDSINEYGVPEMLRSPLETLILKVKRLDQGEPKAILGLALEPPNLTEIERTVLLLKEVGALSTLSNGIRNPHDGDLTFPGRVLAELPVDIRLGKMIILGHVFGCLRDCVIIGAALSVKSIFSRPFGKDLDAFRHKKGWGKGSSSDSIAALNAYKTWEEMKISGAFKRSRDAERNWCRDNFIQLGRIYDVERVVIELIRRLDNLNIKVPRGNPHNQRPTNPIHDVLILKMVMAGAFYPNYFLQLPSDEEDVHRQMSGKDPCTTVMVKKMPPNACHNSAAVAALFRPCGKGKTLHFEETKCFIEFDRLPMLGNSGDSQNMVLPAVYLAVKMRQLRLPLSLDAYEARDEYLDTLKAEQEQLSVKERKLKTNRVGTSFDESEPQFIAPPPPDKSWIKIFVTEISDGNHLWAHDAETETFEQLSYLMDMINGNAFTPRILKPVHVGRYCIAPFEDVDRRYYRARIEAVHGNQVEIFYLDYGNIAQMSSHELQEIHPDLLKLPFQAFECVLCETKPIYRLPTHNRWIPQAKDRLAELALNRIMLAKVFSVVGGVLRIELVACVGMDEININDLLFREELVEKTEEPLASKINHQQRLEQAAHYHLKENYDKAPKAPDLQDPNKFIKRGKVNLLGPYSALEVSFTGVTTIGSMRSIRIERDSVNSVTLDNEPQTTYQKMMVAANVGLNKSGSALIARNTTLMPDIKGLPSLASILFAPSIELRMDKKKTHMTGVLCGLGWDDIENEPILSDHDIEIPFDVKVTMDDITKVNGLRLAINLAIGSPDAIIQWGPSAVTKIQESAREKLLDLILKRRELIKVKYFARARHWNQIHPDDVLWWEGPTSSDNELDDYPKLYEFHNSVIVSDEIEEEEAMEILRRKRRHMEELHKLASRSTIPFNVPVSCEYCDTILYSPREVLNHVRSTAHREMEQSFSR
ncbi:ATP-dependent RNA helicase TDRD9-like [Antedon mediterranea]|uniref:ATP-dependent RNA helicase TDRD9-like n=1 Tax=Antedon mediterranea TaxID=105859 RepID=UPI003AF456AC